MSTPVHIVLAADDRFAQHAGVMLCSLLDHYPDNRPLEIYLLDGGITPGEKAKLQSVVAVHPLARLTFIRPDLEQLGAVRVDRHISVATYFRILIPDLLPTDLERVVYLDADLIFFDSVEDLYDHPLHGQEVGAVPEPLAHRMEALELTEKEGYFNAGVLLIDLVQWRQNERVQQLLDIIRTQADRLAYWDQDALNLVFRGHWQALPVRWNAYSSLFGQAPPALPPGVWQVATDDPAIIHFSASFKPWHYRLRHPYKHWYYHYLAQTPWRDFRPADKNLQTVLRRWAGTMRDRLKDRS